MTEQPLYREWWAALSRTGKLAISVSAVATIWMPYIALTEPVTVTNLVFAVALLAAFWGLFYVLARGELAEARLSDPEFALEEDE